MQEADELCDRVAIINNGELIDIDTPIRLKTRHLENENGSLEDVYIKLIGGNKIA
jgi:ABC-2 type transport system ATP-binding protein